MGGYSYDVDAIAGVGRTGRCSLTHSPTNLRCRVPHMFSKAWLRGEVLVERPANSRKRQEMDDI
jgi:hypothetical protein